MKQRDKTFSPGQLLLLLAVLLTGLFPHVHGQTLPGNFQRVLVTDGLNRPSSMAFTPDGRILIANQGGQLRVFKNGALLSTPALSLTVNSDSERGLIGIAVDPNFSTNKYIYLYYTHTSGPHNRVSRFTLNGDVAGSEQVLLDLPNLGQPFHNGGGLTFGKDGKLYIPVGDNKNNSSVQNLDSYWGKVLRINPDGSVPSDNPYSGGAVRSRIWAVGFRNPWTSSTDPASGKIFVNDVGENAGGWEEIDDITTGGRNYGWPTHEGKCTSGCSGFTDPVYVYQIVRSGAPVGKGCAINGGTFLHGAISNYPAQYHGKYFFHDYCNPWIDYINPAAGATRNGFGTAMGGGLTNIKQGTDGNLYFINRDNNSIYKIIYTGTQAPVIGIQPQNISVPQGQNAVFSVTASGNPTPTYQWRKGTTNISGATAATYTITNVQSSHAGQYNVVVSNSAGSVTSSNATLTVTAPNALPVATILTPANGSKFRAGDIINFSGSATDTEDGNLPASAFEWWAVFHHANHNHSGPQLTDGVTSGSFAISVEGHTETDIWYRLYLAVKDSRGASDTAMIEIFPVTSNLTLQTIPAGLRLHLDNIPLPAPTPYSTPALSGMVRPVQAVSPQVLNGVNYVFDHWEHGGNASQNITVTDNDATYTAVYKVAAAPTVINAVQDAYVRDGSNAAITHGTTDPTLLITKVSPAGQLNNARETYLTFDITTLPADLSAVTLRVFGNVDGTAVTSVPVGVYSVASTTWSESTLSWNNKPATGAAPITTTPVANGAGKYYEWDITSYVAAEKAAGRARISLALKSQQAHDPRIFFNSKEATANPPQLSAIGGTGGPACIPATSSADDGNVAANAIDNDLNTRWSATGEEWIQFCLGNTATVNGVDIAFYKGDTRRSKFDILTSTDGNNWTVAASNLQSSGTSLALESFSITATTAKYVRIQGHGNDQNAWNSYTEVKVKTTAAARSTSPATTPGKPAAAITTDDITAAPNPFSHTLSLTFRLKTAGRTQIALFDLAGKQVTNILNTQLPAGEHRTTSNTSRLLPGVYIIKLIHNGTAVNKKVVKE